MLNGKSFGSGTGHSKQTAAKAAAQFALIELGILQDKRVDLDLNHEMGEVENK
jgi:dsRNA-specific ribonuclease